MIMAQRQTRLPLHIMGGLKMPPNMWAMPLSGLRYLLLWISGFLMTSRTLLALTLAELRAVHVVPQDSGTQTGFRT